MWRETKEPIDESERGDWKTQHSKKEDHDIRFCYFKANRWGNNGNSDRLYFLGLQNQCRWWLQPWNQKTLAPWKKSCDQPGQHIKKQRRYFANKICIVKAIVFPVVTYGCESWTIRKAECQRIGAFELWCWRIFLRVPWTARRSNQSFLKEISPVFIGRTDTEAETPILWAPHVKSWHIGKDPDAGGDWGQEEKGTTEDEMAGWHHWLDGREFEWTPRVGDGQGGLACCNSWGNKESDTTERLNWTTNKEQRLPMVEPSTSDDSWHTTSSSGGLI